MTKEAKMETIMPQADKQEAVEVMEVLGNMNQGEQREMLVFLRGVEFGKRLGMKAAQTAAV